MNRPRLNPISAICPHCENQIVGSVEIRGLYDGEAYSQCPKCNRCWSRKGTPLTKKQVRGITRENIFTL